MIFDGAFGTARHLAHVLEERGLLSRSRERGSVQLHSSIETPDQLALYQWFFDQPLETSEFTQTGNRS